ncbi:MAG: hypothetical protein A2735_00585 [Candidatus Yanofskybacteria bacterium RIFCSPHIGHO2_01_FULL_41_21]|uniref:Metal-dependent hydrolase n=1 Tax=Candidatus Yanofskybacteria bacterium RIFCSPHIGHO2_01_FULL_41_21 TaxID=1802660 RepID=A0A1F8EBS2_9BACT|nr:MAG: hypothetical protein A2735_00585 [Candidatus Yanofskybacteria bacterium RIFCSPHIGHO2_01_FULL_41_21]
MKLRSIIFELVQTTFPDISMGLLVAHVTTKLVNRRTFEMYLASVFFALLPDIDTGLQIFFSKKLDTHHRDLTHLPLVVIGVALSATLFSPLFGTIAAASLLLHFLHDSIGFDEGGWGLKWFWPFSKHSFAFFQTKDGKRHFVTTWTAEEIARRRPMEFKEWITRYYLGVSSHSILAWCSLVLSIGVITWTW